MVFKEPDGRIRIRGFGQAKREKPRGKAGQRRWNKEVDGEEEVRRIGIGRIRCTLEEMELIVGAPVHSKDQGKKRDQPNHVSAVHRGPHFTLRRFGRRTPTRRQVDPARVDE